MAAAFEALETHVEVRDWIVCDLVYTNHPLCIVCLVHSPFEGGEDGVLLCLQTLRVLLKYIKLTINGNYLP